MIYPIPPNPTVATPTDLSLIQMVLNLDTRVEQMQLEIDDLKNRVEQLECE